VPNTLFDPDPPPEPAPATPPPWIAEGITRDEWVRRLKDPAI
jgi:hypothetical protein